MATFCRPTFRLAAVRLASRPMARVPMRSFSTTRPVLLRKYTSEHEWIDVSSDRKTGVVGLTEYAAGQLGDVVYVELPETGSWVNQGDSFGAVESVKSASDIIAPVHCRVVTTNVLLEEKPSTINKVPEDDSNGGGWIARVELDDQGAKELDDLMDADAYKSFIKE
ncbi:hypothetical protein CDD82_3910 [Ophiocordyceps australis]|uniref:Glycine cleavage system H protein n=1 Tax=Ophiocordyceps australis TaxID=1399860 RepID=A0A2C5Z6J8_9HYPO|nr:hypothetical protein CDD82_3910 [Ophiocordyceps australis]